MNSGIKRKYSSPTLTVVKVDQEIALVMMTPNDHPPSSPMVPKGSEGLPQNDPFGGEKPDFSKM